MAHAHTEGSHTGGVAPGVPTALSAVDSGRRLAARRILEGQRFVQPGSRLALQVQRAAVARFWGILSEFCALGGAPEQWQHSAAEGPFISFSNQSQQWAAVRLTGGA